MISSIKQAFKHFFQVEDLSSQEEVYIKYENKKESYLKIFITTCFFVSLGFVIFSFFVCPDQFALYTVLCFIFFTIAWYTFEVKRMNVMRLSFLIGTNLSVFIFSKILGFGCGFYLYFFMTPIYTYLFFNKSSLFRNLYMITHTVNPLLIYSLYIMGKMNPPTFMTPSLIATFFYFNICCALFFGVLLIEFYFKINIEKTEESKLLAIEKYSLENKIEQTKQQELSHAIELQRLQEEKKQLDLFNHIISHNMRAPLSRIIGLMSVWKSSYEMKDDQKVIMNHIMTSVSKMDEVITDLNYILVQKKNTLTNDSVFSLSILVQEIIESLDAEIKNSNAVFQIDFKIDTIYNKYAIFNSIYYNLISNAIKYRDPNKALIISLSAYQKNDLLYLSIKDTGLGIDLEKNQHKLFNLYSRFHTQVDGKGIGLYLVKSHVDMLGGNLNIVSAPHVGTTFELTIPIHQAY